MDNSEESDIGGGVTPIMGSPAVGLRGQVLDSDSDTEFSPVLRREQAFRKQTEKKKRRGNVEVSFYLAETGSSKPLSQDYLNSIYEELQAISEKLKSENHLLYEREQKLKERERMLSISQSNLQTITDHQARQQVAAVQQKFLNQIAHLEQALKEKNKENKRLKENFETMKQANDMFKKEATALQAQNEKLSKQNASLQARLSNLQKKQEFEQRQREGEVNTQQLELVPKANERQQRK